MFLYFFPPSPPLFIFFPLSPHDSPCWFWTTNVEFPCPPLYPSLPAARILSLNGHTPQGTKGRSSPGFLSGSLGLVARSRWCWRHSLLAVPASSGPPSPPPTPGIHPEVSITTHCKTDWGSWLPALHVSSPAPPPSLHSSSPNSAGIQVAHLSRRLCSDALLP